MLGVDRKLFYTGPAKAWEKILKHAYNALNDGNLPLEERKEMAMAYASIAETAPPADSISQQDLELLNEIKSALSFHQISYTNYRFANLPDVPEELRNMKVSVVKKGRKNIQVSLLESTRTHRQGTIFTCPPHQLRRIQ